MNPGQISLNPFGDRSGAIQVKGPWTLGSSTGKPAKPTQPAQGSVQGTLGAEAVRASGSGPYDSAYRQDLATYAGGLAQRPGGNMSFNPTGQLFGNPTGAGNAPVLGSPTDLLSQALSGGGYTTPPPQQTPKPGASTGHPQDYWKFWLNRYNSNF